MKENSIEEDIINAQHFINSIKTDKEYKEENGWHGYYNKEIVELAKILEHILSDYKRVLKENEELKVELERQKDINTIINQKRIDKNYEKALEKSMSKFLKTNMAKDFVPIQKIKDKIEELENYIQENSDEQGYWGNINPDIIYKEIDVLQELLNKGE